MVGEEGSLGGDERRGDGDKAGSERPRQRQRAASSEQDEVGFRLGTGELGGVEGGSGYCMVRVRPAQRRVLGRI